MRYPLQNGHGNRPPPDGKMVSADEQLHDSYWNQTRNSGTHTPSHQVES